MCTSIAWENGAFYFGRNLDLETAFGQQVVITPRKHRFCFRREKPMEQHYAMIGMATVMEGCPLYAEAVNEKGLCIAGLNFPENAYYPTEEAAGKAHIAPFELPWWLLGQCATVKETRALLDGDRGDPLQRQHSGFSVALAHCGQEYVHCGGVHEGWNAHP